MLEQTQKDYLNYFGLGEPQKQKSSEEHLRLFSVLCSELAGRIDAEPYLPRYKDIREDIQGKGGCPLSDIADVSRPASRYKTNYVDDIKFGLPMMNGRQIAQYRAIALRSMSLSAFKRPELFALEKGMTLVTADGRAEENLADCALVSNDRVGWCASGHVHRVRPRQGINAGLVYLACASPPVQAQLKALATGSVVDGLSESDVASVIVPYDDSAELVEIGSRAEIAWRMFAEASESEDRAIDRLEHEFDRDFVI